MEKQDYFAFNPWWEGKIFETGVRREMYLDLFEKRFSRKQIELIIGSRRVGKTTILKQMIGDLMRKKILPKKILYVACDFARAIGMPLSEHLNNFRQLFSHLRGEKLYLFFDEVQDSPNWQIELKTLYDGENLKMFCSGSTSSLVTSHGDKLTGRQINTIVYPLNFEEFLQFRGKKINYSESYLLEKEVKDYLTVGGYPENVITP